MQTTTEPRERINELYEMLDSGRYDRCHIIELDELIELEIEMAGK